jgi:predicted RecB family nuclease
MQWQFMRLSKVSLINEKIKTSIETKKTLKTCKNGHQFFKSSDCPTCLICEEKLKPKDNFLSLLGAPARRALEHNGITTLEELSKYSKKQVLNFHGMGKSTIPKLEKLLSDKKITFNS